MEAPSVGGKGLQFKVSQWPPDVVDFLIMKMRLSISREQYSEWLPVAGLTLVAIVLRAWGLSGESGWVDELYGLVRLRGASFADYYREIISFDPCGPLMPLCQYVLGPDVFRWRVFCLMLGAASIPAIWLLAKTLYGRRAALIVAAWLAFSMSHLYYSQEARVYAMTGLFAPLAAYGFLRALDTRSAKWWAFFTVMQTALILAHILAGVMIGALICFLVFARRAHPRHLLAAGAALEIATGFGLASLLMRSQGRFELATTWMDPVTLYDILRVFMFFSGAVSSMFPRGDHLHADMTMGLLLTLYVGGLVLWASWRLLRNWRDPDPGHGSLPAWWFWVTLLGIYGVTLFIRPCFLYRYMYHALIPYTLLAVYSIIRLPCRPLRIAALAMLAILCGYQLTLRADTPLRWDWTACAKMIEQKGTPADVVAVAPWYHRDSLIYNTRIPGEQIYKCESLDFLKRRILPQTAHGKGVWIVVWPQYAYGDVNAKFLNDLREELKKSGRKYEETLLKGWQPLFVFHAMPR